MRVSDEVMKELRAAGSGPTLTIVIKIITELLEKDKDDLVNQPLSEKTQGKAQRCRELIKLFTSKSED